MEQGLKTDVIIADECQFFQPGQIDSMRYIVDTYDIPVLCFGLRTDFLTHLFPGSLRLFELSDSITEIKTICSCGVKASVNARIDKDGNTVTEGEQIFLGGNDSYLAMCFKCWEKASAKTRLHKEGFILSGAKKPPAELAAGGFVFGFTGRPFLDLLGFFGGRLSFQTGRAGVGRF